uniref:Ig-like domain-containing protein n=1 Tax=Eptatretus burgeri TaxID=7764 RepID=A0A8C4QTI0_EPTBU
MLKMNPVFAAERKTPPSLTSKISDAVQGIEGTPVVFECKISGSEPIDVVWILNDSEIDVDNKNFEITREDNTTSLKILSPQKMDSGECMCKAVNEAGSASWHTQLTVKEPKVAPEFDQKLQPGEVTTGDSTELECHVTGSVPMKVTWSKNGREIRTGGNYRITFIENTPHLSIQKASKSDDGEYSCKVTNEVGSDICATELNVKGTHYFLFTFQKQFIFGIACTKSQDCMHIIYLHIIYFQQISPLLDRKIAPAFSRKLKDSKAVEGGTVKFDCRITGSMPFEIAWFHNGSELKSMETCQMHIEKNMAVLELVDVKLSSAGEYACQASNAMGSASCSANLLVKGNCLLQTSNYLI